MRMLGTVDLKVLYLAVRKNGTFNASDLEHSELKELGVGRILDALASLKDRKMISVNSEGTFSITKLGRGILWSSAIPAWARILRLLQIKSCNIKEMIEILGIAEESLIKDIEKLRKNQMVLMSPQRQNDRLVRIYEILPEGIVQIDKTETDGFGSIEFEKIKPEAEITSIIDEITNEIRDSDIEQAKKKSVLEKLSRLKDRLRI